MLPSSVRGGGLVGVCSWPGAEFHRRMALDAELVDIKCDVAVPGSRRSNSLGRIAYRMANDNTFLAAEGAFGEHSLHSTPGSDLRSGSNRQDDHPNARIP
ncbi:hypothetical protein D3C81_1089250 [compost metagenome]